MKISTLIFACFFALAGFAQGLEMNPEGFAEGNASDALGYQFTVTNSAATDARFFWDFDRSEAPRDWVFTICDNNRCYDVGIESPDCPDGLNIMGAGTSYDYYKISLNPGNASGEHPVTFRLIDACDSADPEVYSEVTITFNALPGSSTNDQQDASDILIFPNPAEDVFQIASDDNVTSISVFNIVGKNVFNESHRSGQSHDVSNLDKGIYLVRMLDRNQNTLKVIRLTKE